MWTRIQRRVKPIQIRSIPSVLVFKNGEVTDTIVGVNPRQAYGHALERLTSGE